MTPAHTLLSLHGLGADKKQAQAAFSGTFSGPHLSIDLPGHAEEPLLEKAASFDCFASWVITVLDRKNIGKVAVAGISMGAGIAVNMALRFPQRVSALVLTRPAWLASSNPPNLKIISDIGQWLDQGDTADAIVHLNKNTLYCDLVETNPAAAMSIIGTIARSNANTHARVLVEMVASTPFKALSDLASISMPSLVIGSPDDPLHPIEIAQAWAAQIPSAELRLLPSRYNQPTEFQTALHGEVLDFFRTTGLNERTST